MLAQDRSRESLGAPHLRRALGPVDLLALGLNATVGSGIFLLPDDLYRAMGPWSPLAFLLCALGLLPVALCYADAAGRTDNTGGPYIFARDVLGGHVGFGVGWMCFVNAAFSFAAVASAAAAYAARLLPTLGGPFGMRAFALAVVAAFGMLNYFGARPGALAVRLFTFGKFAVLFLLILALAPEIDLGRAASSVAPVRPGGIAAAVFMALFALQGFEVVPVPAGEARAPQEKAPTAILTTLLSAAVLYVVVQAVLVLGFDRLAEPSDAPLADAAVALRPWLGVVVAVGALVSTLGFVSGSALGTPRYLFAMARDGRLPLVLSQLHPRFGSPHLAILATCTLAGALVLPFDYRTLIGMSNVAVAVQYGSTSWSVFLAGFRAPPQSRRARRMALGALGALTSVAICFAATGQEALLAATALAVGIVISRLTRSRAAG